MSNRPTRRGVAARPLILLTLAFLSISSVAAADRGRVHLADGSTIRGEIVRYEPRVGVTVELANSSTIELAAEDVARVEIGLEDESAAPTPPTTASAPMPYPGPLATPTLDPPTPRRPRLAGPIVIGSIGLLFVAIGAPMYVNSFPSCDDCYQINSRGIAGLSVLGIGGALVVSGFGVWMARRVKARRRMGSVAFQLAPTFGRHHGGLQLRGSF